VAVLTGATLGAIADLPEIVAIVKGMMTEAEAVANALGVVLPQPMEKRIAITLAAREHRMSML
jgi:2-dehydropantoate 2-reductase